MKALIVDIEGKYAVAMTKKGDFVKVRNNPRYQVGYEVDIHGNNSFVGNHMLKAASMAAAILLVVGLGFGAYTYSAPYSYIGVDINPSIEIVANRYDRVLEVKALNEDAAKVLSQGNYKNVSVEEGIGKILDSAVKNGYLKSETKNTVMLTVTSKNESKAESLKNDLGNEARKEMGAKEIDTEVLVEKSTAQKHESAETLGISTGKLILIERLIEGSPELSVESLKDRPVKEIVKAIKDNKEKEKQDNKSDNNGKTDKGQGNPKADKSGEKQPEDPVSGKPDNSANGKDKVKDKVKDKSTGNSSSKEGKKDNSPSLGGTKGKKVGKIKKQEVESPAAGPVNTYGNGSTGKKDDTKIKSNNGKSKGNDKNGAGKKPGPSVSVSDDQTDEDQSSSANGSNGKGNGNADKDKTNNGNKN